ncbi:Stp1/IreP family PP2C-type Ser/Thr phosphatase [Thiohalomonas denitrificans]|uniref:Protein phosphatase n=1 Tax=Thiohalomonas denitrificans TaxID=415747 RepID=A0A1G5PM45_9GAMM|nr:Stp1/IreP family PP2C-type Ser/Thr phosphatase [Thiohalomonas denitrificans]SCZ50139.1 protein phosphatase [Thiohalomonas denitrificans]
MNRVRMWGMTDPGLCRERNEDAVAWSTEQGWALVADGMGGHQAGEVASDLVAVTARELLDGRSSHDMKRLLRRTVTEANRRIHAKATLEEHHRGMGATVVLARFTPRRLVVAHVGDSRLYRLRDGQLTQLTRDHSLVQELVEDGMLTAEEARHSPHRHVITRAVGHQATVEVEVVSHHSRPGDRVLLCSDGLSDLVDDDSLAACLVSEPAPERAVNALMELANQAGGKDNIAALVAEIH